MTEQPPIRPRPCGHAHPHRRRPRGGPHRSRLAARRAAGVQRGRRGRHRARRRCGWRASTRPDVVVMDIRMPNGSGIDACRAITAELPATPVDHAHQLRRLRGAVRRHRRRRVRLRPQARRLDRAGRRRAHRRGGWVAARPGRHRRASSIGCATRAGWRRPARSPTSPSRSGACSAHLADGASNREIADRMGLAEKTVRNYVSQRARQAGAREPRAGGGLRDPPPPPRARRDRDMTRGLRGALASVADAVGRRLRCRGDAIARPPRRAPTPSPPPTPSPSRVRDVDRRRRPPPPSRR